MFAGETSATVAAMQTAPHGFGGVGMSQRRGVGGRTRKIRSATRSGRACAVIEEGRL
ncbi:hypothetical protein SK803_37095 [Lentzea sp. BCCO 10_0856]|uniref:Uncharacterized protein n=1 Tax=Lentzea miocenica TaxID=3095431 RepID=A0ABU4TD91_9PSEU|nr:hypothetical protein [Lentzea sp. BCCO 10_0856]MDX8035847.1 hypothetical protein [Lentzea sp. BCCO 10_0856]